MSPEANDETLIVGIVAAVELQSDADKQESVAALRRIPAVDPDGRERAIENIQDPSMYTMCVRLVANLSDGRQASTGVRDFSFSGPRHGVAAIHHRYRGPKLSDDPGEEVRMLEETYHVGLSDVQDAINQMLGRDLEQHSPPRLSWMNLLAALSLEGVSVAAEDLIAARRHLISPTRSRSRSAPTPDKGGVRPLPPRSKRSLASAARRRQPWREAAVKSGCWRSPKWPVPDSSRHARAGARRRRRRPLPLDV